jgi:hypothetical protein
MQVLIGDDSKVIRLLVTECISEPCIRALHLYLLLFFETYHKKSYIFTFLVFLSPD